MLFGAWNLMAPSWNVHKGTASDFPEPTILKLWNTVEVDSRAQYELVNVVAVNCEAHAVTIEDST